ncbi:hypothetical protein NDU88_005892 [Pleurodeles waltl]|uniref:Uncharacterized protein n=1 Tax=Pleurodeles waltl TaxID=8319 RepID=A0AAV7TDI9_PLEWA|nr:hypothetical protein NDU88_005892 [Pleurodeles waltl]
MDAFKHGFSFHPHSDDEKESPWRQDQVHLIMTFENAMASIPRDWKGAGPTGGILVQDHLKREVEAGDGGTSVRKTPEERKCGVGRWFFRAHWVGGWWCSNRVVSVLEGKEALHVRERPEVGAPRFA